ncbi:MAG: RidA family protein [Candidatus Diapherotrites archaeon]|nr:RidA family protein [Candidatus Diapherotrites archaeon]
MEAISTNKAPAAVGPYSQAIKAGNFVFTAGQIALTPEGELVNGGIAEQTEQVVQNLKAVLEEAGTTIHSVVKTTVYLAQMSDFALMNEVYGAHFTSKPARSTIQAAKIPRGALVEIDVIAVME